MTRVLKLVLLLVSCSAANPSYECADLFVYDEKDKVITDSVCVGGYTTEDCGDFFNSFNQSDLPAGFPRATYYASRPFFLDVENIDSRDKGWLHPGFSITWLNPFAGKTPCFGYLLVWFIPGTTGAIKCRLYETKVTTNEFWKFKYIVPFLREQAWYTVRVYSMPPRGPQYKDDRKTFAEYKTMTSEAYKPGQETYKWTPLMWYYDTKNGTINLKFTLPPAEFNITHFMVTLAKDTDPDNHIYKMLVITKLRTTRNTLFYLPIRVNETGVYKVRVRPQDEYRNIPGKCRCWAYMNNEKTCMDVCWGIASEWFTVKGPDYSSLPPDDYGQSA